MFDDFDTQVQSDELIPNEYEDDLAPITRYYEVPTQVRFVDINSDNDGECCYIGGIAYRDEIICGCCGGIIEINDLLDDAYDLGIDPNVVIMPFASWIDISEEIKG